MSFAFPVDEIIRFRHLYNQINDENVILFYKFMIKKFGKNVFITPFCINFYIVKNKKLESDNYSSYNPLVKDFVTPLTQQMEYALKLLNKLLRNQNNTNNVNTQLIPELTKPILIQSLPSVVIGSIASYLRQKEYIVFLQTCRSIFIGCNSPNTLTELNIANGFELNNGKTPNTLTGICRYKKIKSLTLVPIQYLQSKPFLQILYDNNKMNKNKNCTVLFADLNKLHINAMELESNQYDLHDFIYHLIHRKIISATKISEISFIKCNELKLNIINKILSILPNIDCMKFIKTYPQTFTDINDEEKKSFTKNLQLTKGFTLLSCKCPEFTNFLIHEYGNIVEFMRILCNDSIVFDDGNMTFDNLNKLHVHNPNTPFILKMLKKCNKLKILLIDCGTKASLTYEKGLEMISSIFIKQNPIQTITITTGKYQDFSFIFDGVEKAINKYNLCQKDSIHDVRIYLVCAVYEKQIFQPQLDEILQKVIRILNELVLFNFAQHFMFNIELKGNWTGDLENQLSLITQKYGQKIKIINQTFSMSPNAFQDMKLTFINSKNTMHGL